MASALVNVTRTVGEAVGLAVISTIMTSHVTHQAAGDNLTPSRRHVLAVSIGSCSEMDRAV